MRRVTSIVLIAASAFWLSDSRPSAQQTGKTSEPTPLVTIQATSISDLRRWDPLVTEGSRSGTLRRRSIERDPMLPLRTVERFEQYYHGVRMWGADVVRDSEEGVPLSIFGVLSPDLTLSADPTLTPDAASIGGP